MRSSLADDRSGVNGTTRVLDLPDDLVGMHERVRQGRPLAAGSAATLLRHPDLLAVASLAGEMAERKWQRTVAYSRPLRLPLRPICTSSCRVCSSWRLYGQDGWHSVNSLVEAAVRSHAAEVHLVTDTAESRRGDLERVEQVLRGLRDALPTAWLQGLTPAQVHDLAQIHDLSLDCVLRRLQSAGLDGLLGCDEEIYALSGRILVPPGTLAWRDQMAVHEAAHAAGLVSVATLRYGPADDYSTLAQRLEDLRAQQHHSAGFSVFAPLPGEVDLDSSLRRSDSGFEDLRIVAVGRLALDNIPHIRLPWSALGLKVGQVALSFGADDLGWQATDPHVRAYAHPAAFLGLDADQVERLAAAGGKLAVQVDGSYRALPLRRPSKDRADTAGSSHDAASCAEGVP